MSHGHVSISNIALLVFDEAHHCTLRHPYMRILDAFYHTADACGEKKPHILGLTASPSTSDKKGLLQKLESNMEAVCRAPTKYLNELQQHVHVPKLLGLVFDDSTLLISPVLLSLDCAILGLDLADDPNVRSLDTLQRTKFLMGKKPSFIKTQLETLLRRGSKIHRQLGPWGTSFYLEGYLTNLRKKIALWRHTSLSALADVPHGQEVVILHLILSKVLKSRTPLDSPDPEAWNISSKAKCLLTFLASCSKTETRAIIFVKERSTAAALSKLISDHPLTRNVHSAATVVGIANGKGQKAMFDMMDESDLLKGLEDFRQKIKNILVGTSVTEEGIDIPSANLVIRFDEPANFRAFIQSRGRARHAESRFVWMRGQYEPQEQYERWLAFEQEMKAVYQDTERGVSTQDEDDLAELSYDEELTIEGSR